VGFTASPGLPSIRFRPKADIRAAIRHVCFTPENGHPKIAAPRHRGLNATIVVSYPFRYWAAHRNYQRHALIIRRTRDNFAHGHFVPWQRKGVEFD
jgi:hypothetical protein